MKNHKMKRSLFILLLVVSMVSGLVHFPIFVTRAEAKTKLSVTVRVDSKKVNKKTITMKKGSSKKIKLSLAPNQSGLKTKYQSNKKGIVSVSKSGTLKAKKAGTAKIIVTVSRDNIRKVKLWFKVKVTSQNDSGKKAGTPVNVTVNGQTFKAVFYNNKTADALLKQMPITLNMKELNGNEKYHYFDTEFPTNEKSPGKIETGDRFGHSSLLLQMHGMNILIDPVFSERSSPVSFVGTKRFSHPPVEVEDLPAIDLLVLSHDHYDHLDYNVIKTIDEKVGQYIVPLGVENHLERWGVDEKKIKNMAWWEETTINGLTVGCTPARHYSGRSLDDQFATLWASWVFQDEYHKVFESGDSGYGEQYKKIHDKYGDFDFVMTDCAQYDVNWPEVHMFPEEAVQAAQTLGAKVAMPIHWGTFSLANHPWDDSVERFVAAGEQTGLQVMTPQIGETINLNSVESSMDRWWKDIL